MASSLGCQEGIRYIREALGVQAAAVAERLNKTRATYYRIENGDQSMRLDQAVTVAKMFGVTVDMLTRRPTTDELLELTRRKLTTDEPVTPAPDVHQPEIDAIERAGGVMGDAPNPAQQEIDTMKAEAVEIAAGWGDE